MTQLNSSLLIQSKMSNAFFDDFCQNYICSSCSHASDSCFPPRFDDCPESGEFLPLYNAMWLASLSEYAMYDYEEDSVEGTALFNCWREQESICNEITAHIESLMKSK